MSYSFSAQEMEKLHTKTLDALKFFKDFCEENGLLFYLCGGCCIGAVREGGFLGWDDDGDVFMPRRDYERLREIWRDTDRFVLLRTDGENFCGLTNTTLVDTSATVVRAQQASLDIPHGVVIDIFPLDGCPSGFRRVRQKINAMLFCLYVTGVVPVNHGRIVTLGGRILLSLKKGKRRTRAWQRAEKKMSRYPIDACDNITELTAGPRYMSIEYPKELFASATQLPFEDTEMPVPVGYDAYLKAAFGDYMTPPPEDKRVSEHDIVFVDLDKPCK